MPAGHASLVAYLVLFAHDLCETWWHFRPTPGGRRDQAIVAIAEDVASTNATPGEALDLMNIAAAESTYRVHATGKLGEQGPWQVRPPATSYGAREALRRLRVLGIYGFMGCREGAEECERMAHRRTDLAHVYAWAHPFGRE
jgi:hypothetical protein